jgi:hypothetical protein
LHSHELFLCAVRPSCVVCRVIPKTTRSAVGVMYAGSSVRESVAVPRATAWVPFQAPRRGFVPHAKAARQTTRTYQRYIAARAPLPLCI